MTNAHADEARGHSGNLRPRWRATAGLVLVMASASLVVGCAAIAADSGHPTADPSMSEDSRPKITATPTPTSSTTVRAEEVREAVPFTTSTIDDPNLDVGTTALFTAGRDGERTITYEVVYEDGVEVERSVTSEVVSVPSIDEVTAVGTRVPPPPPAPEPVAPAGGCDPNYSGPCVPVAPDVDCAGGSGNGPGYVSGPVYVVGVDIYDLDRDGDGIGCD
jgi:hypothetical protein